MDRFIRHRQACWIMSKFLSSGVARARSIDHYAHHTVAIVIAVWRNSIIVSDTPHDLSV
jgi:hypothetical protein